MGRILKYVLIGLLLSFFAETIRAQQMPQFSQFMENKFLLNPALAGTTRSYEIRSINRFQWVGFADAPQTYTLSVCGPAKKKPMGFGAYVYSDILGPTSRTGLSGSYAYNIAINEDLRLSGGISLGIQSFSFDGSKLRFGDSETDPALNNGSKRTSLIPDVSVGLFAYSSSYYGGLSVHQLIGTSDNQAVQHFYLTAGYIYFLNSDITMIPSLMVKFAYPSSPQPELNIKGIYDSRIWAAVTFRTFDSVGIMGGYIHDNRYYFGYSFDFSYNALSKYNSGSHEIMVGVKFDAIK